MPIYWLQIRKSPAVNARKSLFLQSLFYLDLCTGSLVIVLLTTWFLVTPGAPHCRRWHEASGGATGARYAGTPTRLADKADVWTPPPAGEPVYSDVYLQVL